MGRLDPLPLGEAAGTSREARIHPQRAPRLAHSGHPGSCLHAAAPVGRLQQPRALPGSRSAVLREQPSSGWGSKALLARGSHACGRPGGFRSSERSLPSVPCRPTIGSSQSCPSKALTGAHTCGPGGPGARPDGDLLTLTASGAPAALPPALSPHLVPDVHV